MMTGAIYEEVNVAEVIRKGVSEAVYILRTLNVQNDRES
jgi:hypothetical protein